MKLVEIFTDGACSGNPGPGGWRALLRYGKAEKMISGSEEMTTNNRMELSAVVNALCALKEPCEVTLTSDSKYVTENISLGRVYSWRKKGWKKSDGEMALNIDLWEQLLPLLETHKVKFVWIRGHKGHPENELCDKTAVAEYQKYK